MKKSILFLMAIIMMVTSLLLMGAHAETYDVWGFYTEEAPGGVRIHIIRLDGQPFGLFKEPIRDGEQSVILPTDGGPWDITLPLYDMFGRCETRRITGIGGQLTGIGMGTLYASIPASEHEENINDEFWGSTGGCSLSSSWSTNVGWRW